MKIKLNTLHFVLTLAVTISFTSKIFAQQVNNLEQSYQDQYLSTVEKHQELINLLAKDTVFMTSFFEIFTEVSAGISLYTQGMSDKERIEFMNEKADAQSFLASYTADIEASKGATSQLLEKYPSLGKMPIQEQIIVFDKAFGTNLKKDMPNIRTWRCFYLCTTRSLKNAWWKITSWYSCVFVAAAIDPASASGTIATTIIKVLENCGHLNALLLSTPLSDYTQAIDCGIETGIYYSDKEGKRIQVCKR